MNKRVITGIGLSMALVTGAAFTAKAADKAAVPGGPEAAMMQRAQQYMTPGPEHKALEPMVGKWNAKVSMWMKPGDQPQESTGVADITWALNNHFLKQDYTGSVNGQPFSGIGYTGFDKVRGEYQAIWMDTMATGMMFSSGGSTNGGKVIQQSGTFGCPMTGDKQTWYRTEMKMDGNDKIIYNSYGKDLQGKEFKGMEIIYTRVK